MECVLDLQIQAVFGRLEGSLEQLWTPAFKKPGVEVYTCQHSIWEAEAEGLQWVQG